MSGRVPLLWSWTHPLHSPGRSSGGVIFGSVFWLFVCVADVLMVVGVTLLEWLCLWWSCVSLPSIKRKKQCATFCHQITTVITKLDLSYFELSYVFWEPNYSVGRGTTVYLFCIEIVMQEGLISNIVIWIKPNFIIEEGMLEAKTECYAKNKIKSPPFFRSFYNNFQSFF